MKIILFFLSLICTSAFAESVKSVRVDENDRIIVTKRNGDAAIANNFVGLKYGRNGGGSFATTSEQNLLADTKIYDTIGGYDTSTGIWTAPVSGYYSFICQVHARVPASQAMTQIVTRIYRNAGTSDPISFCENTPNSALAVLSCSQPTTEYFSAGQTARCETRGDTTGANWTFQGGTNDRRLFFQIKLEARG